MLPEKNTIIGRVHNVRNTGKIYFLILKMKNDTLQCIGFRNATYWEELQKLTLESLVQIYGHYQNANVKSCSIQNQEFVIEDITILSLAEPLPFQLEDANTLKEHNDRANVLFDTRLDKRYFDLRTPLNHDIFRAKSLMIGLFQKYAVENGFIQIQTPKIIAAASEGGSNVFELKYFDKRAYLAQSPQLYKQMLINADYGTVFEIGPVFRAENSHTNRHLCEFTGIDIEMDLTHVQTPFTGLIQKLWAMLRHILTNFKNEYKSLSGVLDIEETIIPQDEQVITFQKALELLRDDGKHQGDLEDLSSENEYRLGQIMKEQHGTDLFFITHYPLAVRPFYTMPCPDNPLYSNSFDIIYKCQEISSGAQRQHQYSKLVEALGERNINPAGLEDYLDSFRYGSRAHGGCGFGLDRIVSLYLGLGNVKRAVLFPRDTGRLTP